MDAMSDLDGEVPWSVVEGGPRLNEPHPMKVQREISWSQVRIGSRVGAETCFQVDILERLRELPLRNDGCRLGREAHDPSKNIHRMVFGAAIYSGSERLKK